MTPRSSRGRVLEMISPSHAPTSPHPCRCADRKIYNVRENTTAQADSQQVAFQGKGISNAVAGAKAMGAIEKQLNLVRRPRPPPQPCVGVALAPLWPLDPPRVSWILDGPWLSVHGYCCRAGAAAAAAGEALRRGAGDRAVALLLAAAARRRLQSVAVQRPPRVARGGRLQVLERAARGRAADGCERQVDPGRLRRGGQHLGRRGEAAQGQLQPDGDLTLVVSTLNVVRVVMCVLCASSLYLVPCVGETCCAVRAPHPFLFGV